MTPTTSTLNRSVQRLATARLPTLSTSLARPSLVQARSLQCRQFGTTYPMMESVGDKMSDTSSSGTTSRGEHTTDKDNRLDVQSEYSGKGQDAKANNEGGSATSQSDARSSTERAKKDHPEAPDVVIGMQDERGGKGH
ncbi:hypothetical protein LTS18_014257 [Coniosporium uncinatum]|uniref:Uncharacterized protein n=1 Tax=Coniosporium uncinatum TaxID=93489 RepID=A0ACC3D8M9_9PEZI|nr:hypothetical protein LTS18_014257 [Coniosporium uncinatum]